MAQDYIPATLPTAGQIVSVVLQMITFGTLCICFTRRSSWLKNWRTLPPSIWLVLLIYIDSTLFVLATAIVVQGLGINSSRAVCESGILLCLVFYASTKVLIYFFLVERAYIVRGSHKPRLETKLWLFNCLFMMLPYNIVIVINFVWRFTYINDKGVCIVGMEMKAMLPLITFEVIVNVYLTLLFVLPLRQLYSYRNSANPKLNRMAFRSLIGSLATLSTSVANMTVLMLLRGEPGWICLMCCNADILFCVLVLHWVTSNDQPSSYVPTPPSCIGPPGAEGSGWRKQPIRLNTPTGSAPEQAMCPHARTDVEHCQLEHTGKDLSVWPYNDSPSWPATAKLPGSVTTDIRSSYVHQASTRRKSKSGRVLRKNRDDASECGDEVELHSIHVQREVCIDSDCGDEADLHVQREMSEDSGGRGEGDVERRHTKDMWRLGVQHAWGAKKSVSAEEMI